MSDIFFICSDRGCRDRFSVLTFRHFGAHFQYPLPGIPLHGCRTRVSGLETRLGICRNRIPHRGI